MQMARTSLEKRYQRNMVSSFIPNRESFQKKFGKQVPQSIEKIINNQEGIRDTVLITGNKYSVPDWTYSNQKWLEKKQNPPLLLLAAKNTEIGVLSLALVWNFLLKINLPTLRWFCCEWI